MVRKLSRKMIVLIAVIAFVGVIGIIGWFLISGRTPPLPILTEEQHALLERRIRPEELEEMGAIEKHNAWMILDAMEEVGFREGGSPGESRVSGTILILGLLGVGEFAEFTIVQVEEEFHGLSDIFLSRIINNRGEIYYMKYIRGIFSVNKGSEDGEEIYSWFTHGLDDYGNLIELEFGRGAIRVE